MTSRREFLAISGGPWLPTRRRRSARILVLILPDQMRGQDMGCAGNADIPHAQPGPACERRSVFPEYLRKYARAAAPRVRS